MFAVRKVLVEPGARICHLTSVINNFCQAQQAAMPRVFVDSDAVMIHKKGCAWKIRHKECAKKEMEPGLTLQVVMSPNVVWDAVFWEYRQHL